MKEEENQHLWRYIYFRRGHQSNSV